MAEHSNPTTTTTVGDIMGSPIQPTTLTEDAVIPVLRCFALHEPGGLRAIARLSESDRVTVIAMFAGATRREVAGARDVSRQSVHKALAHVVKKLGLATRMPCTKCLTDALAKLTPPEPPPKEPKTPRRPWPARGSAVVFRPVVPNPKSRDNRPLLTLPLSGAPLVVLEALKKTIETRMPGATPLSLCVEAPELTEIANVDGWALNAMTIGAHLYALSRIGLVVGFAVRPWLTKGGPRGWTTVEAWRAWQETHPQPAASEQPQQPV